jgi:hypothetical protein
MMRGPMSSRRWLVLAGCVLVVAVYGLRLDRVAGLYVDDAWYVLLGQAIASGQGYRLISAPTPAMAAILPAFPPGFPLVLALVMTVTPAFPANVIYLKLVSIVAMFGVGGLSAAYYRHRGVPLSFASALAITVVLTPAFVWLATSTVMSEPLFACALLGAVVLVLNGRPVAAGVTAAAAALVRSAGLPAIAAVALWYAVRRDWRSAIRFVLPAMAVLLPWAAYSHAHATPLALRLQHGGAHVFTYGEQFWMRRAGEIESGRISWRDLPARVGAAAVDIFGRDVGAIVLPEVYRQPIESGEETLSVGGKRTDLSMGSMGNATGTLVISGLLSLVALVGFVACCRREPGASEYVVACCLVPIVLFPHWAYRLVLPLTPFLYFYLLAGVQAMTSSWARAVRIAIACVLVLHVVDHARYRLRLDDAVWRQDARETDEVLDWMQRTLTGPGGVASTNPALVYLWTGRKGVAIDDARARWTTWRSQGIRYVVCLQGHVELPERSLPYRVLFRTARSEMWVVEATDADTAPAAGSSSATQRFLSGSLNRSAERGESSMGWASLRHTR